MRVNTNALSAPAIPSGLVKTMRNSPSVVIARLVTDGITVADRIYHLDWFSGQMQARLPGTGADLEQFK